MNSVLQTPPKSHLGHLSSPSGIVIKRSKLLHEGATETFDRSIGTIKTSNVTLEVGLEHFEIICSIAREAVADEGGSGRFQVERLIKALGPEDLKEKAILERLLVKPTSPHASFAPAGVVATVKPISPGAVGGEPLTKAARVPVDRETSSPLAEIFPLLALKPSNLVLSVPLQQAVDSLLDEWNHLDQLQEVGIEPSKSLLLFGSPGTGKTQLALSIGRNLGLPVILVRLDGLMSSFLGTTSRNIGNLFQFANRHRALLLLDEFDAIAKLRDDTHEIGEIKRVVNTLLQNLDERRSVGLTIAITNHPQLLDPAIWRRFEAQIEIPKPDTVSREKILRNYLIPISLPAASLKFLSWLLESSSGAEIEDFIRSVKKSWVMEGEQVPMIERLRKITHVHAARINGERRALLNEDRERLALRLFKDDALNQAEIGELLGFDRRTIGRWIKQEK